MLEFSRIRIPPSLSLPFLSSFVSELSQRILFFFFFVYVFHNLNYKRKYFVTVYKFTLMIKCVRRNSERSLFFVTKAIVGAIF